MPGPDVPPLKTRRPYFPLGVILSLLAVALVWFGVGSWRLVPLMISLILFGAAAVMGLVAWLSFRHREPVEGVANAPVVETVLKHRETWLEHRMAELAAFDLSRLNAVGWLLFLSSIAVGLGGGSLFVGEFTQAQQDDRRFGRIIGAALLGLAVVWYHSGMWFLEWIGVPIYRSKIPTHDASKPPKGTRP